MFGTVTRADQLRPLFRRFLIDTLTRAAASRSTSTHRPTVMLMLGVNGSGKTTTCAKLAARSSATGATCCWPPPTRSAPRRSSSWRRGAARSAST